MGIPGLPDYRCAELEPHTWPFLGGPWGGRHREHGLPALGLALAQMDGPT